jgi:hypothetical protein
MIVMIEAMMTMGFINSFLDIPKAYIDTSSFDFKMLNIVKSMANTKDRGIVKLL